MGQRELRENPMPLDLKRVTDTIMEAFPKGNREAIEKIVIQAAIRSRRENGTGFSAQIMPTLRQGDHTVVMIAYTNHDGEVRRMGTMIMPDEYIPEFLAHFGIMASSQNVT